GNPVTGAAAELSAVVDAADGVQVNAFTEASPGVYEATVTSTTAGTKNIAVSHSGSLALGNVSASFVAGPVSLTTSQITLSAGDRVADGNESHSASVTLRDANGNPVADTDVSFTVLGGATGTGVVRTNSEGVAS